MPNGCSRAGGNHGAGGAFGYALPTIIGAVLLLTNSIDTAPAVCRTCSNGACNNTAAEDGADEPDLLTTRNNRTKRESTIEQRSCVQFQLEMVLIPLSIAMIPVGLCALLLCACCCGPEESRGKIPDRFNRKVSQHKASGHSKPPAGQMSGTKDPNDIDDVELVCKDGIVMRRDSKKTRFSTAVSIIEARRISIDILDTDSPAANIINNIINNNNLNNNLNNNNNTDDRRPSIFSIGPNESDESLENDDNDNGIQAGPDLVPDPPPPSQQSGLSGIPSGKSKKSPKSTTSDEQGEQSAQQTQTPTTIVEQNDQNGDNDNDNDDDSDNQRNGKNEKLPRRTSSKKTRFADVVCILGDSS